MLTLVLLVPLLLLSNALAQVDTISEIQKTISVLVQRMNTAESSLKESQENLVKALQRVAVTESKLQQAETKLVQANVKRVQLESELKAGLNDMKNVGTKNSASITGLTQNLSSLQGKQTRHIAFSVGRSTSLTGNSDNTVITYDKIWLNDGNGFNKFNSYFVAPLSGVYMFTYNNLHHKGKDSYVWLMLNGKRVQCISGYGTSSGWGMSGNVIQLKLQKGHSVWVTLQKGHFIFNNDNDGCPFSSFNGQLIYQT